ncbi:MAG: NADH:ubiquinone reductase (Na(+)-transporting) subunit B [Bacteroidales bacterium]|nr:NADH:ubiquinone reductase (Na(+)-transporting) subunit B [Bacteroidales bacterium]MBN2697333.1 NADH:ubiquinone reductase (Na(+)-transporting) subunit B [Bacteroidales bacterium]
MSALRRFVDKIKPHFVKGGRFSMFQSTFEGFETFLFVPDTVTSGSVHIRDGNDMKRTMIMVVLALIPALLFGIWNTGYQHFLAVGQEAGFWQMVWFGFLKVLPIIIVSYVVGLGIEFTFAQIRGHEINEGFLVTGMLIPLVVPVDVPLWMVALATAFAVIIGKEVFGGTGMNILNPALTARAFLFFAYPGDMSGDKVWIEGLKNGEGIVDGFSGATLLGQAAQNQTTFLNGIGEPITPFQMFLGNIPGSIGETSTLAILLGAFLLIYTGVGSWKIILSVFAGGALMGWILNIFAVNEFMALPFWQHLILGGFAFGAVFMATDPVTAAQTERGKWIYGFLIGVLAILIRVLNPAYPEGVMLAILFMNVFSPLIDHYVIEANIRKRLKRAKVQAN